MPVKLTFLGILKLIGVIVASIMGGSIVYSVIQAQPLVTQTLQIIIPMLMLAIYLLILSQILSLIRGALK